MVLEVVIVELPSSQMRQHWEPALKIEPSSMSQSAMFSNGSERLSYRRCRIPEKQILVIGQVAKISDLVLRSDGG